MMKFFRIVFFLPVAKAMLTDWQRLRSRPQYYSDGDPRQMVSCIESGFSLQIFKDIWFDPRLHPNCLVDGNTLLHHVLKSKKFKHTTSALAKLFLGINSECGALGVAIGRNGISESMVKKTIMTKHRTNLTDKDFLRLFQVTTISRNVFSFLEHAKSVDPNIVNDRQEMILHTSIKQGEKDVVRLLLFLPETDVNFFDGKKGTPLSYACYSDDLEIMRLLLNYKPKKPFDRIDVNSSYNGLSPLNVATKNGNVDAVKLFVESDPSIFKSKLNVNNTQPFLQAVLEGNSDIAEVFLTADGANFRSPLNVNETDAEGWTPLLHSIAGNINIAKLLISNDGSMFVRNLDVNMQANDGTTALLLAIDRCHSNIAKLLLTRESSFFDSPIDVNLRLDIDAGGTTPLQMAVQRGNSEILELLLTRRRDAVEKDFRRLGKDFLESKNLPFEEKVNINSQNTNGETALFIALKKSDIESAKLLLETDSENFQEPVKPNIQDVHGNSCLHVASMKGFNQIVELLLHKKSSYRLSPNQQNENGNSALHIAVEYNQIAIVKLLLSADESKNNVKENVGVNLLNSKNLTPAHLAVEKGRYEMFHLLVTNNSEPLDMKITNSLGDTLVHSAIRTNEFYKTMTFAFPFCMDMLLRASESNINLRNNSGDTVLKLACDKSNIQFVKQLFDNVKSVDVNLADKGGVTPLFTVIESGDMKIATFLLESKFEPKPDVNQQDSINGWSALHYACVFDRLEIVQLLMHSDSSNFSGKLNINLMDNEKNTPLHHTIRKAGRGMFQLGVVYKGAKRKLQSKTKIFKLLLESDQTNFAQPLKLNIQNTRGETLLHTAIDESETVIAKMIISRATSFRNKFNINLLNVSGQTALHLAADKKNKEIARRILDIDDTNFSEVLNLNLPDCDGNTPLHVACENGSLEIVEMLLAREPSSVSQTLDLVSKSSILKEAIDDGYDSMKQLMQAIDCKDAADTLQVNLQNKNGETCLHLAIIHGHTAIAKLLITHSNFYWKEKINVNLQDTSGRAVLHLAVKHANNEVAKLLLSSSNNCLEKIDARMTGDTNETVMDQVIRKGNVDLVWLLLMADASIFKEPLALGEDQVTNIIEWCRMMNRDDAADSIKTFLKF